jgi:hypothetical protein
MAESKRIFNQAKIDRDLDARLLPPGVYRDGFNVNVGESEGGDVGAIENLKGNEEIAGQTSIEGTTIGSVRDPDNNKIYWFNKGVTTDAIYEYDEQTGNIKTILKDKVSRPLIKPKCAPDFNVFLDPVPDDTANRSDLNIPFTTPLGGCTTPGQFNYDPNAEYNDGSCVPIAYGCTNPAANNYDPSANTDDGSCVTTNLSLTLSGASSATNGSNVNVTSNVSGALGSISYAWSDGTTASNNIYTGSNTPITKTLTITDAGRTAPNNTAQASKSVTFTAPTPNTYNLSASTTTSVANSSASGGISGEQGTQGVSEYVQFTATITPASGYQWSGTAPTFSVSGLPSGMSAGSVSGGTSGTGPAAVLISGNWTPAGNVTITVNWTGGGISQIPTGNHTLTINNAGSSLGANITAPNTSPYNATIAVGSSTSVAFNGTCSPASGYEWVTFPTVGSTNLPSGVTLNSPTGGAIGGTGARNANVSGTWSPTSAGTTTATVTWTGGSVQASAPACNNYQVTYTGNNGQLNYTNCTTGNASTYNLPNSSGTNVIVMQSRTFPTQGAGSGYTIYNIQQI